MAIRKKYLSTHEVGEICHKLKGISEELMEYGVSIYKSEANVVGSDDEPRPDGLLEAFDILNDLKKAYAGKRFIVEKLDVFIKKGELAQAEKDYEKEEAIVNDCCCSGDLLSVRRLGHEIEKVSEEMKYFPGRWTHERNGLNIVKEVQMALSNAEGELEKADNKLYSNHAYEAHKILDVTKEVVNELLNSYSIELAFAYALERRAPREGRGEGRGSLYTSLDIDSIKTLRENVDKTIDFWTYRFRKEGGPEEICKKFKKYLQTMQEGAGKILARYEQHPLNKTKHMLVCSVCGLAKVVKVAKV